MNDTNSYMFDIQSIIFARINEIATEILAAITQSTISFFITPKIAAITITIKMIKIIHVAAFTIITF